MKEKYKTIVISDVHLGIRNSRVKELVKFLKQHKCEKLILNGDIIDGWQLRRCGAWKNENTKCLLIIMKEIEQQKTKVIYLRGNHDDFLNEIIPFQIGNFSIENNHIHESFGKKYFVVHGDIFDPVTTQLKWLAKLGDISYTFILWLNRHYNNFRVKRGLPYYSLSQIIKHKVKSAVSFISDYEEQLSSVAKAKKCDGIICGHIHQPANKTIDDVHYLNSGDWVESLTALAETYEGEWKVIYYEQWSQVKREMKKEKKIKPVQLIPDFIPTFTGKIVGA